MHAGRKRAPIKACLDVESNQNPGFTAVISKADEGQLVGGRGLEPWSWQRRGETEDILHVEGTLQTT